MRSPREEFTLALLQRHPELAPRAGALNEDLFTLSENRELFRRLTLGQPVSEDEVGLWEPYQRVIATPIHVSETAAIEAAFFDCVARLEQARMKAVKEASALALAEGEASLSNGHPSLEGGPGEVAAIAKAKWEAGNQEEALEDRAEDSVVSQLLRDMEAGLRFHRGLIDSSRGSQGDRPIG